MYQHSFRPNYSTSTAFADVLDFINTNIDNKLSLIVLFADISKAFDNLNRNIFSTKLGHNYGVRSVR